ncbi:hypothetical protein BOTBODRAFT_54555 [Botryobasidium botryosum FD-172 SS1]|uniref:RNA helicase n=1 Tax=Botryobasidium botryosum (strain FD-172 SS1) TaxID=930990 RepID=A0A067MJD2_BOTB1|nr:hypothetical protein BOTBODRAFT_54555 [Botryobasidium botryosum FD-172 SS1]
MPPRKGIVKSGNAGNSSKAPKPAAADANAPNATSEDPEKKHLFPPGSKTPLNLLHERCQKNGWEKPNTEARRHGNGWTCVIKLARQNKKTSTLDTVVMEPHPPLSMGTVLEAKHWGATYALYRFSNGLQLNRVLPPGPREYWNELAAAHKTAPDHLKWQYEADPFAARKAVDERQEKAAARKAAQAEGGPSGENGPQKPVVSREFEKAPEVRMAARLRELVESAIKTTHDQFPDLVKAEIAGKDHDWNIPSLEKSLRTLGFRPPQIQKTISFLTTDTTSPSAFLSSLLALPPLEACLSYLLLHTPEPDLPASFLSSQNSSESFVRGKNVATDDLATKWVEERAIKEAGWPEKVVKDVMRDAKVGGKWELLIECLCRKLLGKTWDDITPSHSLTKAEMEDRDQKRAEDLDAVVSVYPSATFNRSDATLSISLPNAPHIALNILHPDNHPYPSPGARFPPLFVSAPGLAPYTRLHLLSTVLNSLYTGDLQPLIEAGECVSFTAVDIVETEWQRIEKDGPPDVAEVMKYLLPSPKSTPATRASTPSLDTQGQNSSKGRDLPKSGKKKNKPVTDDRTDAQVLAQFQAVTAAKEYVKMLTEREKLPAWRARGKIVNIIARERVVVVVGETGSGKTTQLPQFILDSAILSSLGASTNVVITQPRRVSAISVAARVSAERLDDGSVGYAVRGDSKWDRRTKLLFCTQGVLLRRMTHGGEDGLAGVSHVVVDEVHERSVDGDFLLLELRELLKRNKTLKIILMSATINQQTFVNYFEGAPVIEIPGLTHPVKDFHLEDILPSIQYRPPLSRPSKNETEEQQRAFREEFESKGLDSDTIRALANLSRSERLDYQLIAAVISYIISRAQDPQAAILVFLPGVQEIRQCIETLRHSPVGGKLEIFPLHANLSSDEQRRVFMPTQKRKVVVATNVAETSITIPDVVYVLDSGKVKEMQYDPASGLSRLLEVKISQASGRQRRGRAGRTKPGECYKLFTQRDEKRMQESPVPEILRIPLENLLLQVKVMREQEDAKVFLSKAISPPKLEAIEKAWSVLVELGAVDGEEKLTALGRHMSLLPVDLRMAKMMILGSVFRCVDPILTMAACLSSKPLFTSPQEKREEAKAARARFAMANSDLLTDMKAYHTCIRLRSEGKSNKDIKAFCETNFMLPAAIQDITSLRHDFMSALAEIGFIPFGTSASAPELNVNSDNTNLLKSVILGGLWPRVARISLPKATFDQLAAGTIQRDHEAREFKMFDIAGGGERVFLHPGSMLFTASVYKSPFLAYFSKNMTSKLFLRDATEVPLYALLLFGGLVTVNHIGGGLTVGESVKLRAWPRIGVLVNQLRQLLDAQLDEAIEQARMTEIGENNPVVDAMLALVSGDGLSA